MSMKLHSERSLPASHVAVDREKPLGIGRLPWTHCCTPIQYGKVSSHLQIANERA